MFGLCNLTCLSAKMLHRAMAAAVGTTSDMTAIRCTTVSAGKTYVNVDIFTHFLYSYIHGELISLFLLVPV